MLEEKKHIYHLLKDDCSVEELDKLHEWLVGELDEENASELLASLWAKTSRNNIYGINKGELSTRIKASIQKEKVKTDRLTPIEGATTDNYISRRRTNYSFGIIGSVLALTLIIGYFITANNTPDIQSLPVTKQIEKSTSKGHRSSIQLRDGSKVILNAESKITYDDSFGLTNRRLYLQGEAFFEVARNESLPFTVISENLVTRALGTSFNVRDYGDEATASIALSTGIVRVKRASKSVNDEKITLKPNEQIVLHKVSQEWSKLTFSRDKVLSWKDNIIYFNDILLSDIIKVLERWYDVNIEIQGEGLEKLEFKGTGTFEQKSLENVLESLGYTMGFESSINDKQIIIQLTN